MRHLHLFSGILLVGVILTACGNSSTDNSVSGETAASPVKVLSLNKSVIARTVDYTANILAYDELQVAPASPGRIVNIYVEVGDKVKKGKELFLMDRTTLNQQKVQLASLERDLARLDTLLLTGSVQKQQYDQMKVQYDIAKSNVDFMENNTLMTAPFDGIITGRYYENGEIYSGSPSAASGGKASIVTLMKIDPVKVKVSISEQYLPLLKVGMKAKVVSDVYSDMIFEGKVSLVYPTVDATTRTFPIELEVSNKDMFLRPGMFVRISMDLGAEEAFAVPSNLILMQEGTNTRYLFVEENGTVRRVNVTLGKRFDDVVEIVSGELKEGDRVVSEGQSRLVSGDKVEVVE